MSMNTDRRTTLVGFGAAVMLAASSPEHLALDDQQRWDKYKLADLAGGTFKTNTLIDRKHTSSDSHKPEDPHSLFGTAGNSIPALQERGVVFMACHNAIWEVAEKILA